MMLTLLISGPKQPGNDIDIFLEPLVDDLRKLWDEGIEVYDGYRQQTFKLRALLLWTINDFPTYGNLSGHAVKGYYACPVCSDKTHCERLKHGKKQCYAGHRRFLPMNHHFRKQKKAFNGKQDFDLPPHIKTGEEIMRELDGSNFVH